jgi:2-methylcitrate dehydratase
MAKLPKGRGASIEITFASSEPARETVEIPEGDAQRPLSQASLDRKFMNFAVPVVGSSAAERIVALVKNLDHLADVSQLMSEFKGSGKQAPT